MLKKISEVLQGVGTMGIAGHIRPDGDCVGSCLALYLYMKKNYPEISGLAYDFYLQKVNILFHMISPEQYIEFRKEYDYLYDILNKNLKYVLFKSRLSWKYRIRYFIDILKLRRQRR